MLNPVIPFAVTLRKTKQIIWRSENAAVRNHNSNPVVQAALSSAAPLSVVIKGLVVTKHVADDSRELKFKRPQMAARKM